MSNPTISEAKALAMKHDKTHLIIFHLDKETGKFGYASYGINKKECSEAKGMGGKACDEALSEVGRIISQRALND